MSFNEQHRKTYIIKTANMTGCCSVNILHWAHPGEAQIALLLNEQTVYLSLDVARRKSRLIVPLELISSLE